MSWKGAVGWWFWCVSFLLAQPVPGVVEMPSPAVCRLQADLERLLESTELQPAFVGVVVQSLQTGEIVIEKNPHKLFVPASLLKLFTTAAALDFLGADYRFRTVLLTDGFVVEDSILRGNLILWSNGNPAISPIFHIRADSLLALLAARLKQRGIRVVEGDIVADDSYFDREFWAPGWDIDDIGYAYAAPVSALAVDDNCIHVVLTVTDTAAPAILLRKDPDYPFVNVQPQITLIDSGTTDVRCMRDPCAADYTLQGTFRLRKVRDSLVLSIPVDDPALFAAFCLQQALQRQGIRVRGSIRRAVDAGGGRNRSVETLVEWFSPPLADIIAGINRYSYNLGAEMLLKTLGKIFRGEGSRTAGIDALLGFVRFAHIDVESLRIADGSGLSRLNLLSPTHIAQLLTFVYHRRYRDVFLRSLARPGEPGTLQFRLGEIETARSVFAKTGTLTGVSGIAGYCFSRDREPFVFVVVVNNAPFPAMVARNIQDLIILRIANFSRNP